MATKKRETNFTRSYSDKTGEGAIAHNDAEVLAYTADSFSPKTVAAALLRYCTDVLVGVGNAVLKADGSIDDAVKKMGETLAALQSGEFAFRSASGQGGLSVEDEQALIAGILAEMGKAPTVEAAAALVAQVYGQTAKNVKGHVTRPAYNKLKNVPGIKAALAKASKADESDQIDNVLSGIIPAQEAAAE